MQFREVVWVPFLLLCACAVPEDARGRDEGRGTVDVIAKPELAPPWTVRYGEELWRRPVQATGAGIDVGDVIERVSHAIARDVDGDEPRVRTRRYTAELDGIGLRFMPPGDAGELRVRTAQIALGDQVVYGGAGAWSVLGNTAQVLRSPTIVEHFEAIREGVELTWVVRERGAGDLMIEVAIAGDARAEIGPAVLVDAAGQRWGIETETMPAGLRWRVASELLDRATFPVALDPIVSAELTVDDIAFANSLRAQVQPNVTSNASGYFVTWVDSEHGRIAGTRVTPAGNVMDPAGITIAPVTGSPPRVASNGTDFLVVFNSSSGGATDIAAVRVSAAGVVLDSPFIAVCTAPDHQTGYGVASNGTDYLVTWADNRPRVPTTFFDVYAARVTAAGAVLDPNGFVVTETTQQQLETAVASDGTNYLVLWQESTGTSTGNEIYASRITAMGSVLDPSGFAITSAAGDQLRPRIAFNGADYLAVWEDGRSGVDVDIYGTRLATNGSVADPNGIAITTATNDQSTPTIASNGTDFLVSWRSVIATLTERIETSRVTAMGAVVDATPLSVSTAGSFRRIPSAAAYGADYLVAWQGRDLGDDIRAARISSVGAVSSEIAIALSSNEYRPAIASNGTNYLVVWQDARGYDATDFDIYGARLSGTGAMLDPAGLALSTAANAQSAPAVASNGTDYLVAWQDLRGATSDVYATRVTGSGTIADPSGLAVTMAADDQSAPAVASNGSDYVVAWQDHRNGTDDDVYATRFTSTGSNLDSSGIAVSAAAGAQRAPTAASNGDAYMLAWEDARAGSGIYASGLSTQGAVLHPAGITVVTGATTAQTVPTLASNGTDYLVAWEDDARRVNARRINAAGMLLDSSPVEIGSGVWQRRAPAVASNGIDYVVFWQDQRNGAPPSVGDVYASRVTPAGVVWDGQGVQIAANGEAELAPVASYNASVVKYAVAYEGRDRILARLVVFCGDGLTEASETCDDSDRMSGDGCSSTCWIEPGWQCSGTPSTCTDLDECTTNNGGCAQTCTNSSGSYSCSCGSGYVLAVDGHSCDDIDECATANGGCAGACTNSIGSYSCSCPTGYMLGADGDACVDIDECATSNSGCAQTCTNNAGSYSCSCGTGYTLDADGHACSDIDECATDNGGCDQTCTNSAGSFTCGCNPGYVLAADGFSCELDEDDDDQGEDGCSCSTGSASGSALWLVMLALLRRRRR